MRITAQMVFRLKNSCHGAFQADADMLRTTINVRKEWQEKISTFAESRNMDPSYLIRKLLHRMVKVMSKLDDFGYRERPMIYQKKGFSYSVMHVSFSADEYSRFKDVMGCSRFCLSAILGMAMLIFDELLAEDEKKEDSYPEESYVKQKLIRKEGILFIHYWKENTT